jgi:hypothetical protein
MSTNSSFDAHRAFWSQSPFAPCQLYFQRGLEYSALIHLGDNQDFGLSHLHFVSHRRSIFDNFLISVLTFRGIHCFGFLLSALVSLTDCRALQLEKAWLKVHHRPRICSFWVTGLLDSKPPSLKDRFRASI